MTKVQNPVIGRASGQAGGMVFQKMYDKNVMRAKPFEVRDAKTAAQLRNREATAMATAIAKGFNKDLLINAYPVAPASRSRYAEFLKELNTVRDVSGNPGIIDLNALTSFGSGVDSPILTVSKAVNGTDIEVSFTYDPEAGFPGITSVVGFGYHIPSAKWLYSIDAIALEDSTFALNTGVATPVLSEYVCFVGVRFKAGADLTKIVK